MAFNIGSILTGGLIGEVKGLIGAFKLDPTKKAELQAAVDENASLVTQKELDIQGKIQDSISQEIQSASEIIKAEATSQSWLPRNVRPLLLLVWGLTITFNVVAPMISRIIGSPIEPLVLDPWIYKLTAIGFTGYVTMRSFEKWKGVE